MIESLKKFESRPPQIVFEWNDTETDAKGWVVINSLRGGAAGGGTRMRIGLNREEVIALAKTMEIKFTVSGPPIGGAKSGINFDPADPRKRGVLQRWYEAVTPLLKYYYGTGGDLNVDEVQEVIPITEDSGIWHPQEGVFTGHFHPTEAQKVNRIGQLRHGVKKIIEDERFTPDLWRKLTVADMITGYGVAMSVLHYYAIWGGTVKGKKVLIQGWGNVGAAAGFYLAQAGAVIGAIIDKHGGIIEADGLTYETVRQLFLDRVGNKLSAEGMVPFETINEQVWDQPFDVFIPAAASRLVTKRQVESLTANGLEVISCGANVPFQDEEIFIGPTAVYADEKVSLIPDFIANCGMARVFAYLMGTESEMLDEDIFGDVSDTIQDALQRVFEKNPRKNLLAQSAFEIALAELL